MTPPRDPSVTPGTLLLRVLIARCGRLIGSSTLVLVLAAAATACGGGKNGQTTSALQPTTQTFVALADTYVRANEPLASFGKNGELRVDDTPIARSYIRFEIFGIPAAIARATLRLYTLTSSGDGFQVRISGNSWIESRTTYRNAPAVGRLIAQSGSFFAGQWVSIDVTPAVRSRSMTLDLAFVGIGARQLAVASRERTGHAPQLVIVTEQAGNP
jgi:acid phosphatase type 7